MHRHFGRGEFQFDETSFDVTAYPPSKLGFSEYARTALWRLRQDPDTWPRNDTTFENELYDGPRERRRLFGFFRASEDWRLLSTFENEI